MSRRPAGKSVLLPLGLEASQSVLDGIQDHVSVFHFVLDVTDLVVDVLGSLVGTRRKLPIRALQGRREKYRSGRAHHKIRQAEQRKAG